MKLRKLLVLIMCAVLVTVGGVYATWNYAMGQIQSYNANIVKPVMANAVLDASIGTLKVDTRNLSVRIDDANNDKVAELVIDGYVLIVFAPHADADPDIIANGIDLKYTIEKAADINNTFAGTEVFTFTTQTGTTGNNFTAGTEAGTLEYTIDASVFQAALGINQTSLPTYDDYQAFQSWIPNNLLKITIEAAT